MRFTPIKWDEPPPDWFMDLAAILIILAILSLLVLGLMLILSGKICL